MGGLSGSRSEGRGLSFGASGFSIGTGGASAGGNAGGLSGQLNGHRSGNFSKGRMMSEGSKQKSESQSRPLRGSSGNADTDCNLRQDDISSVASHFSWGFMTRISNCDPTLGSGGAIPKKSSETKGRTSKFDLIVCDRGRG